MDTEPEAHQQPENVRVPKMKYNLRGFKLRKNEAEIAPPIPSTSPQISLYHVPTATTSVSTLRMSPPSPTALIPPPKLLNRLLYTREKM